MRRDAASGLSLLDHDLCRKPACVVLFILERRRVASTSVHRAESSRCSRPPGYLVPPPRREEGDEFVDADAAVAVKVLGAVARAAAHRGNGDIKLSPLLPKRPDRDSRPPSWGRTQPVTVDAGTKHPSTLLTFGRGRGTPMLGKVGGGAGRGT